MNIISFQQHYQRTQGRQTDSVQDLQFWQQNHNVLLLTSQVYYWRDSSQLRWLRVSRAMKSQAFPNNDPEPSGVVTGLFPYSNYMMYIVVANNRYEGPPSNNIPFSTPEGGKRIAT